jgi:hypothetical protein
MFFPPRYLIRALKATIFVTGVFALIFLFFYLVSETKDFSLLLPRPYHLAAFCVLFGIVYPLVSFVKKTVPLDKPLNSDGHGKVLQIFVSAGYMLDNDDNDVLTFRRKNRLTRAMRLFGEDAIELSITDTSLELSGMRRDIYLLARPLAAVSEQQPFNIA